MSQRRNLATMAAGGGAPAEGWDITTCVPNFGIELNTNISAAISGPTGLVWAPDGMRLYITDQSTYIVYQYDAVAAWSTRNITSAGNTSVATLYRSPQYISFRDDGTEMYLSVDSGLHATDAYALSTAWDVTTASRAAAKDHGTISMRAFNDDGTKGYGFDLVTDEVVEYSLSTAWDPSTASDAASPLDHSTETTAATALSFSPDGTVLYVLSNSDDKVYSYDLSTAWDVSTGTAADSFNVPFVSGGNDVAICGDGRSITLINYTSTRLVQWGLIVPFDLGSSSGNTYAGNTLWVSPQEGTPRGITFKPDGTKMYIVGISGDEINQYSLSTAWDVSTGTAGTPFNVYADEVNVAGLFLKPDGTKVYIIGHTGDEVNEYDLSSAWDTSTATLNQTFSVASEEGNPRCIFFKPDGTRMYTAGPQGEGIDEYSLSTAWDISTASWSSFTDLSGVTDPGALHFSADGTRLYVADYVVDVFAQYSLSTAWDSTTLSSVASLDSTGWGGVFTGIFLNEDGTTLYAVESAEKYILSFTLTEGTP